MSEQDSRLTDSGEGFRFVVWVSRFQLPSGIPLFFSSYVVVEGRRNKYAVAEETTTRTKIDTDSSQNGFRLCGSSFRTWQGTYVTSGQRAGSRDHVTVSQSS